MKFPDCEKLTLSLGIVPASRDEISSVSFTPPPRLFHLPKESSTKEKGQDSSAAIIVDFMDPEGGTRRGRRRQFAVLQIFFCAKKGRAERKEGE